MNTFTVDELTSEPDRFAAAVARDGTALLRIANGDEYGVRPAEERPRGLARIKGVHLTPPLRPGELVQIIQDMHAYEPEGMIGMFARMNEAKRRGEAVMPKPEAASPDDAAVGRLPSDV